MQTQSDSVVHCPSQTALEVEIKQLRIELAASERLRVAYLCGKRANFWICMGCFEITPSSKYEVFG